MHTNPINPTSKATTASRRKTFAAAALAAVVGATALVAGGGSAGAIVNGAPTPVTDAPWQVSLQNDFGHYCGGSIIDANTVLTAAHCVTDETAAGTTIRAGVTDTEDQAGQDRPVTSIRLFADYVETGVGDIAVVKLAQPLNFNASVQPIDLASRADINEAIAAGANAETSGWGALAEDESAGDSLNQLLVASVPLVDDETCTDVLGTDADGEVCAGGTGTDSCYGDSGGPLVIRTDEGPKLAGVVSWGEECGGETPGAYAEVPNYLDLINDPSTGVEAGDESLAVGNGEDVEFDEDLDDADFDDFETDGQFDDAEYDDFDVEDFGPDVAFEDDGADAGFGDDGFGDIDAGDLTVEDLLEWQSDLEAWEADLSEWQSELEAWENELFADF